MPGLLIRWLGRLDYAEALALQDELVADRRRDAIADTLLLLEHAPVITLGRSSDPAHLLAGRRELAARGIEVHEAGRGGDVTYHGPGQLVGYPVLALRGSRRDAHRYLRDLEQALIDAAAAFGVRAARQPGLTGIWIGRDKLAAIGVRLNTGWITSHGFAFNVAGELDGFEAIVPCGIADRGVTSLERLTGVRHDLKQVAAEAAARLADVMQLAPILPRVASERLAVAGARELSSSSRSS